MPSGILFHITGLEEIMTTDNDITLSILNMLYRTKACKPKISQIVHDRDIQDIWNKVLGDPEVTICFVGYLEFKRPKEKGCYPVNFPVEVRFDIHQIPVKDFNNINWKAINNNMGYQVMPVIELERFLGRDLEFCRDSNNNKLTSIGVSKPKASGVKCICNKEQVLYKGCICGGN